jgi:hypothetical protein
MKSRLLLAASALFTFVFFSYIISNGTYASSPMLMSAFGAAIISICLTQAICNFNNLSEFTERINEEDAKDSYKLAPFILPISFLFFTIFMYITHKSNVEKELKEFGITSVAEIIDGSQRTTRSLRNTTNDYNLTLRFSDKTGTSRTIYTEVDGNVYDKVGLGLKVPIIYSSKNINLIKVIVDIKGYLEEYKPMSEVNGQKNEYQEVVAPDGSRNINVSDMLNLDKLPAEKVLENLNNISQTWEMQADNNPTWANTKRGEMVLKNPNGITLSILQSDSTNRGVEPHKYLNYIGFQETTKDTASQPFARTYKHEAYVLTIKSETSPNMPNSFVKKYNLVRKQGGLTAK